MNKFVQRNINELKRLKQRNTKNSNKATVKGVEEIIKLYTERNISNVATAENLIKGLTSDDKRTYEKAFQKYKDNINKFKEAKPIKERIAETKERKKDKTYFINFQIYTWRSPRNEKMKSAFSKNGVKYYIDSFDVKQATIKIKEEFPKDIIKQVVYRYEDAVRNETGSITHGNENEMFRKLIKFLRTDDEFNDTFEELMRYYDNLFQAIKITSVEFVNSKGEKLDILRENLTDATNISIYHRYITTPIYMEASTIHKAIQNGNHIENECWINALTDFYKDTLMSEKNRNRLTREKVIEIIGRGNFHEKGASIAEMEQVFKQYRIQVRIFDFMNRLIYKHDPEKRNHHIETLYAMVKNNHIYVLNHDLKSIQQGQANKNSLDVKASTDYYLNEKDEPPEFRMIKNINEILKIKGEENEEINIVLENNNLTEIFFQLVKSGYEPRISFQSIITEIRLKLGKTKYIINTQNLIKSSCDGCIAVDDEITYNRMNKAMFNFNKSLFNPIHKSFYNDIDVAILNEARTIVPSGLFCCAKAFPTDVFEADVSKAFTLAFMSMNEIPVFNQFDIWQVYTDNIDITTLHDLTLYYVEVKEELFNRKLLFNKKYCLIYGLFLKKVICGKIRILYYKQPSRTYKCNYKEIIDELWKHEISSNSDLDKTIKKLIANINFGLLEKGGSTSQKRMVFKHLKEAVNYQVEYGGKIHKLTDVEVEHIETKRDGGLKINEYENKGESYYVLNLKDKAQLQNGFRYIKELLLQYHNFKMYQDYYKLRSNGVKVYSVKTDAFVIQRCDEERTKEILNFHNGIGGWRISKYEDIKIPSVEYEIAKNEIIEIPTYEHKVIEFKNECDTDNIIEVIKKNNPMMIRGVYPGTGKSFICQKMVDKGYKVIFVCPTNRLLQEFEGDALTLNKFFGISFGDVKLEPFDYSGYDVIVFDEIYFSSLSTYWRIKQFVEDNKQNKIVIATGDTKQLKPIQPLTNIQEYEVYADHIINNIFTNSIILKECKRLKTQEDKDKLSNVKTDIFVNKLPFKEIIEKYFRYTTSISGSKHNIAYLNDTCKNVASEIRKLEKRKDEYEVGEFLICREYTKTQTSVFNVNFKYKIVHIGKDGVMTLKNTKTNILQSLKIQKVRDNFIFAHCTTCHSAQGSSIDGDITIFDYNHYDIKKYREWLWTAITRARDLNKVKFYKYSDDVNDDFNYKCIKSKYERKIENYKQQDRKAKRKIPKECYVNVEWFFSNITNQCNYCGCGFHTIIKGGNITTNLTAQRVNNEYTHTLDNIIPYCDRCNCSCR